MDHAQSGSRKLSWRLTLIYGEILDGDGLTLRKGVPADQQTSNIQRPTTHPWPWGVVRFTYRSIVASSPALWSSRWSKISSHSSFFWVCDQINFDEQFLGIFFGHFLGLPQNYEARSELRKRCTIGHAGFPTLLKSWEKGTFLTGFADPKLFVLRTMIFSLVRNFFEERG